MRAGLIAQSSITFRLTLLFAAVSSGVLLLLGLLVGTLAERHFEELDVELLNGKLELVQHTLKQVGTHEQLAQLSRHLGDALVGHPGLSVLVIGSDGQRLFSDGDAGFPEAMLVSGAQTRSAPTLWSDSAGHQYRGAAIAVHTGIDGLPPVRVVVATDMAHHKFFMRSFQLALWSMVGLAALLTGFLGWAVTRHELASLKEMKRRAADITAHRLDRRLPVESIPVELAETAETFNEMLARLEASFRRLADFSSDLAHELRTPVSVLLTQTQVTLSRNRSPEEYREVLASNVEEFERLTRMIEDMLFLAKADNDLIIPVRERVDLSEVVNALFEFCEALAEEKQIRLTLHGDATVAGDRLMLRRAVHNLLSNALRHTSAGGNITVRLTMPDSMSANLSMENTGETIPPEHLARIFDRFFRVDASRQRDVGSAGLGLAITRSIVLTHGGDVSVQSREGVTRFELKIPSGEALAG